MVKRFQNKVVIVTGSSNGIGRDTAVLFAEEGAKLTITGRNETTLEETRQFLLNAGAYPGAILTVQGDLINEQTQKDLIEKTVEKFGKIDILVNNAGGMLGAIGDHDADAYESEDSFDYCINLNLKSVFTLTKLAIPHLIESKGEVINVSSIAALKFAMNSTPSYAMSKAALDQFTRSMAVKYIAQGVRFNSVNPGAVHTNIMEKAGVPEEVAKAMFEKIGSDRRLIPAGVGGQPRDIANVIAFLADRSVSSFIVGQTIIADGGTSILNPMLSADMADLFKPEQA